MENASKALVMAGSILISIIILGILLVAFNNIKQFPKEQEEKSKIEQLGKFNAEYEAYNKEKMYGTDVITVLNKANNNNIKYLDSEGVYDIDIEITLLTDIVATATIYSPSYDENGIRDGKMDILVKDSGKIAGYDGRLGEVLKKGKVSLLKNTETIQNLLNMSESFTIPGGDQWNYTVVDTGFKQFKRKLFKCSGMDYSATTGRVSKMYFEEIS